MITSVRDYDKLPALVSEIKERRFNNMLYNFVRLMSSEENAGNLMTSKHFVSLLEVAVEYDDVKMFDYVLMNNRFDNLQKVVEKCVKIAVRKNNEPMIHRLLMLGAQHLVVFDEAVTLGNENIVRQFVSSVSREDRINAIGRAQDIGIAKLLISGLTSSDNVSNPKLYIDILTENIEVLKLILQSFPYTLEEIDEYISVAKQTVHYNSLRTLESWKAEHN